MLERTLYILTVLAALGSGLVAGVFFAFSTFVMAALGRIAPESGISAMQAINVTVINPAFMLAFLGTGLVCLVLAAAALLGAPVGHRSLVIAAGAVYLVASIGVTMAFNVPLNDALAALQPGSGEAATLWARYLKDWTVWNHVRTFASLGAAALFALALR